MLLRSLKNRTTNLGEILCLIGIAISVVSYDLIYFSSLDIAYGALCIILYSVCFSWYVFVDENRNPAFVFILFFLIRVIVFTLSLSDLGYLHWVMFNGDASFLHIPTVLNMRWGEVFSYLTDVDSFAVVTGRITHIYYFFCWSLFNKLFYFPNEVTGVMIVAYVANTAVILSSGVLVYRFLTKIELGIELVSKGVFLYLLSPFVIAWGSMAMKESLITMFVVIVTIQIYDKKRLYLIVSTIVFMFERLYMVYFPSGVLFFSRRLSFYSKAILFFCFSVFLFLTFPMEDFIGRIYGQIAYQAGRALEGASFFKTGIIFDILRTIFSPSPIASFSVASSQDFFYRAHYILQPVYIFIMFRIILSKSKFSLLILLVLLINMVLFPYGARQKITLLIPFLSIIYPIFIYCKRNDLSMHYFWKI